MPFQNFSTGKDVTLQVVTPDGILSIPLATSFKPEPEYSEIKSKILDGRTLKDFIPDGWKGTIQLDRSDAGVDQYFAQLEDNYYNGVTPGGAVTIFETIQEKDGSITEYRYDEVSLKLSESGEYSGDKKVEQKIEFHATRRRRV